ncbi:odorant receptor 22c-like [Topomyia yanbarensis]|uniref:odorant receptor 22c-like n=1 Tax=Topomyia yanbarensis TaxID=2498891 RepID=UPI00273B74A1|nr:odorant receptor 22c-like [Topomyia yanbarensis]
MKALIETIITVKVTFQAFLFANYRPQLERIFAELQSVLERRSLDTQYEVQNTIRHLQSSSDWLIKVYLGIETFSLTVYCVIPTGLTILKYATTGIVPPLIGIAEADFVLFDFTSSFWIWLPITLFTDLIIVLNIIMTVIQDSFYWCLLHHVSCLFKIIKMQIIRLDEFHEAQQFHEKLIEIVLMQGVAYRSLLQKCQRIKTALSALMLLLYGTCMCILCMTMMVIAIASGDTDLLSKMGVIVYFIFFQIFSYSMLGTELMTASSSIADAVYATHWYKRSIPEQRNLLFVLKRSQRMATLTAANLFGVSRATFTMTIRSAFSYFTVLWQFYGTSEHP